ncbi:MAG: AzlD domain-containing protein [Betaproteobacteria bacterium]|jgi:uncharacterized membrane protein|nr:AzlD domain-containing protein [Betaproteobacteria bacterium]NBP45657.1 AzlD domain-containing protein [Betaproteobacteria bacterium]
MHIDATGWGSLLIIAIMTVVTLATRWSGVLIMTFIPLNDRVKRFISAMSGSVLIAVLAPMAVRGDAGARGALAVTALAMLILKKPLPSIALGLFTAAWIRHAFG